MFCRKPKLKSSRRKSRATTIGCAFVTVWLAMLASRSQAFSLLGPYADWMYATNGYHLGYDIGGPMDINEGYRWNVPVVTYGFDKSFIDYFGSNGVVAVESAIQIINDLPPASDIVLSNYPMVPERVNFRAVAGGLYDLKSTTLALLFEQLGLTQPVRNIFDLRQWTPALVPPEAPADCAGSCFAWAIPNFIIERNFDPETLAPSLYVNDVLYSGFIYYHSNQLTAVIEFPVDPLAASYTAVGDAFDAYNFSLQPGLFYTGFSGDDVGGLRYLLNRTNVNYENLLPDVYPGGNSKGPLVNAALRPGVEKITFSPYLAHKNGGFNTVEIPYTDTYIANGMSVQQNVRRIIRQPDILFSAADIPGGPFFARTGTTNWANNAALNGDTNNSGPGVIRPPITITFHKLGPTVETAFGYVSASYQSWGSFDQSTNVPLVYPIATGQNTNQCTVHANVYDAAAVLTTNYTWHLAVPVGSAVALQINTNGTDWTTLTTVANTGGVIEWVYFGPVNPLPGFNVVPAP